MRKFDTKVQHLKYKVLREVARQAFNGTLLENMMDIPGMQDEMRRPMMLIVSANKNCYTT